MFVLRARKSRRLVGVEMSQISTPPSSCPAFANLWASSVCRSWSSASEVVFSAPVDVVNVSRGASRSRASSKAVRSTASEPGDWPTPTIHRFVGKGLAWRRRMTATAPWAVRATPAAVDPDRSRLECVTPFQPTQIMAAERGASTSTPTVQLGDTGFRAPSAPDPVARRGRPRRGPR